MQNSLRQRPPAILLVLAAIAVVVSLAPLSYLAIRLTEFGAQVVLVLAFGAAAPTALALYALVAVGAVDLADVMRGKLVRLSSSAQLFDPLRFVPL